MNVVRFNEPFESLMTATWKGLPMPKWEIAPLFDYHIDAEEYKRRLKVETGYVSELFDRTAEDDMPRLPFRLLRLHLLLTNHVGGRFEYSALVGSDPGDGYWAMAMVTPESRTFGPIVVSGFKFAASTAMGDISVYDNKSRAFLNTKEKPEHAILAGQQELMKCGSLVYGFALDAMAPTNHMVEVKPDREHKSVEWTRARTHYTLITHDHPANNKAVQHRASVTSDPNKELQRMAHNRRAHFKTLRHERYKYARGKRIFVRAAWVGPKEWKDEGGKQIYRILEPVDVA